MGLIAAEALGVPLSKRRGRVGRHRSLSVLGRRVGQPHDDHDRLRRRRGGARPEEADRRERACRRATRCCVASATPSPRSRARCAARSARTSCEVEVDTELGGVRVTKYVAVHDSGRIMNPLSAKGQIQGAGDPGHRHGAARGPRLRPPQRPAADGRLLRRAHRDASRRAGDRGHLHRERRWLRAVRREEHRRGGHHPVARRRSATPSSTRSAGG